MADVKIYQAHPGEIVALWPQIEPWLSKAFKIYEVEYTLDQLKTLLVVGQQTLLAAVDEGRIVGAATISTQLFPNETVAFITALGGEAVSNTGVFNQLREWCRSKGHTCIRGAVRKSVARLYAPLGFKEMQQIIEVKI